MERLSMASYLYHGHSYHLYTYGSVGLVPDGVVIKDAKEIVPESEIQRFKSLANFSDYFRYNLLLKRGGWWCDTDTICLRPFDLKDEHVFVQEYPYELPILISSGYLKSPANSPVMQWLVAQSQLIDWSKMSWGDLGPGLVTKAVERFALPSYPYTAFNPIPYKDWTAFIEGSAQKIHEEAFAVHLWHEMWRREGEHGDLAYPAGCLYEQLKRRYGIAVQPGGHNAPTFSVRYAHFVRSLRRRARSAMPHWVINLKRKISALLG